jgi:hypothetical protein
VEVVMVVEIIVTISSKPSLFEPQPFLEDPARFVLN